MQRKCKCEQWNLRDDDNYCGYCGALNLPLHLSEDALNLVSGVLNVAHLTLRNSSDQSMRVVFEPPAGGCDLVRVFPAGEIDVPANGEREIRVELALDKIEDGFKWKDAQFHVVLAKNKRMRLPVNVRIKAGPKLCAEPSRVRFPYLVQGSSAFQEVRLRNAGQLPLSISGIVLDGGVGISIEHPPLPVTLAPEMTMAVRVMFVATAQAQSSTVPALLRATVEGLAEKQDMVEIVVRNVGLEAIPRNLVVDPCLAKHRHSARITLKNSGSEDISIVDISCADPWVEIVARAKIFTLGAENSQSEESYSPISQASFDILLRTDGLESDWHKTAILVRTNLEAVRLDIPVRVRVVTPAPVPHHEYVGIDFGTTASVVSILDSTNVPRVIEVKTPTGVSPLIPSVLVMKRCDLDNGKDDDYVIGYEAKNLAGARPGETVRSIKRILGYGSDREILGRKFTPEDLAARIIRGLADIAEKEIYAEAVRLLGPTDHYSPVTRAMVTVPANFYDLQIRGILEACRMAGLDTEEERAEQETREDGVRSATGIIIDEPSAAAMCFLRALYESGGVQKVLDEKGESIFLIYDHGGGTLDVSVVKILKAGANSGDLDVRVLANKGNNRVGGDSIDLAILKELVKRCGERYPKFDQELIREPYIRIDHRASLEQWSAEAKSGVIRARHSWKDAAEAVKIALSTENEARFFIDPMSIGCITGNSYTGGIGTFEGLLKTGEIEELLRGLLIECRNLVKGALELADISEKEVDFVVHTGRTSYMPLIGETIGSIFPSLSRERFILDPENLKVCVAKGASFYGAMRVALSDSRIRIVDEGRRLPHAYGVQRTTGAAGTAQFQPIIEIGAECPASGQASFAFPPSGRLQLIFYQNAGRNKHISRENTEAKRLGQFFVDSRTPGHSKKCDVRFAVDANRVLKIYADGFLVPLQPERLKEDDAERWIG